MPNKMDVRKRFMSVRIERELFYKLQQEADERGIHRSDFVLTTLKERCAHTVLCRKFRDKVAAEIEEAKKARLFSV